MIKYKRLKKSDVCILAEDWNDKKYQLIWVCEGSIEKT